MLNALAGEHQGFDCLKCLPQPIIHKDIYTFVKISGKGIGIIASRDIKCGELIIEERPTMICKSGESLQEQFKKLSAIEQKYIISLSNVQHECRYLEGILKTNAFYRQRDNSLYLFIIISRFNHSCLPNVHQAFRSPNLRIYASRHIMKGEELCITYVPLSKPMEIVRQELLERYCFVCMCELCVMKDETRIEKIKKYRRRYWAIDTFIAIRKIRGECIQLDLIHEIFKSMKGGELWFPHLIIKHAYDGFEIAFAAGQLSKARSYIKLAYKANLIAFGKYSASHEHFLRLVENLNHTSLGNKNGECR